ncbi:hypothetical protein L210DRAFT_869886, partial [Boletus edulis BED1]
LQHSQLSLLTALIKVLCPSEEDFAIHREQFYDLTRKMFNKMDGIKDVLRVKTTDVAPDFLANWDIASTIGAAILEHAPVLT